MPPDEIEAQEPVRRVAELANKLTGHNPEARGMIRDLFEAFQQVQAHFDRPQLIATAPREPELPLQLFCPDQGGWHVGEWWPTDRPRWVAVIDADHELQPTHWAPTLAWPMTESEIIAWTVKGQTGPTEQ
jgi:hypothetical protein